MKPYIVLVHQEGVSAHGVTFPDAPDCFSAADEIDDLFAMAGEALEGWTQTMLEFGHPSPPARGLAELQTNPQGAESFAGAVLALAWPAPRPDKMELGA